jgi:hypothetical protein
MAKVKWESRKEMHCSRIDEDVTLDVQVIYPEGMLADQPPRVLSHRCSHGIMCNQFNKPACRWAGTLPDYDPF